MNNKLSKPESRIFSGKFCIPEPITMRGKFSTTYVSVAASAVNVSSNVATFSASTPHGYATGAFVDVFGSTTPNINGKKRITVINSTDFTFDVDLADGTYGTAEVSSGSFSLAIGTGTFAGTDFGEGDWIYVPTEDLLVQVGKIYSPTKWLVNSYIILDNQLVLVPRRGLYKGISVKNTGGADGLYKSVTLKSSDLAESNFDQAGLEPVCGDATGTTFKLNLQL